MTAASPPARPRAARYLWLLVPPTLAWTAEQVAHGGWSPDETKTIVVVDAWLPTLFLLGSAASYVAAMVLWVRRPWIAPHPLWMTAAAGAAGWLMCGAFFWGSPSWSERLRAAGPGGREYALLHWHRGMGTQDAIGRVVDRGLVSTKYEMLVRAAGGSPGDDPWASVVRPAGSGDRVLHFPPDGRVVAAWGGRCYLAAALDGNSGVWGEALLDLSPFMLLDAATPGEPADLDGICADVTRHLAFAKETHAPASRDRLGLPTESSLLTALDSPNPWIRSAARRIVEAGGAEMYPEATRKLAPR